VTATKRLFQRSRGFALILALFMLVTLAAIGTYLLTISTGQVEAGVQDEQGQRAYQAARAGIEWGAFQVLRNPAGAFTTTTCNATGTPTQPISLTGGLAGYRAEVGCRVYGPETEGTTSITVYRITSTGCNSATCGTGVGPTYVERQLQLTLTN
jgi:MSHA biogenesis protein MshP